MKTIAPWIPALYCAVLSAVVLIVHLKSGANSSAWEPGFYCFLPMCFFFVGSVTAQLHKELKELRQRLAVLEEDKSDI